MGVYTSSELVSRELVRKYRDNLSELPHHEVQQKFDLDKAWLEFHLAFQQLKSAYRAAAKTDCYLSIFIS